MSSIRRKANPHGGTAWQVRWRLPNGRERTKTFPTQKAAKQYDAALTTSLASGRIPDWRRGMVSLSQVHDAWMPTRQHLKAKTRESDVVNWRVHVGPAFGNWPVGKITAYAAQEWVNGLNIGASGKRSAMGLLRNLLDYAVRTGLVPVSPLSEVRLPPIPKRKPVFLTPEQVEELASQLDGRNGDFVRLLSYLGLRVGELTALQVGDLSTDLRRIHIHRSGSWVNGHLHIDTPKTTAGARTIPVPGRLKPIIEREIKGKTPDAPLFSAPMGGYFSAGNFLKRSGFKKAAATLGVPALRIHDLRHTYASLARSSGADLKTLQVIMGHSSITVTADLYSHLYDDELDKVAMILDTL